MPRIAYPRDFKEVAKEMDEEESYADAQERMRRAYGENYPADGEIAPQHRALMEQLSAASAAAAEEFIGMPNNESTRAQMADVVGTTVSQTLSNSTLRTGQPLQLDAMNLEMHICNITNVVKDEHGNPLVCYGCMGSAADVSYPSYGVEWRCTGCIRSTNSGDLHEPKFDKYLEYRYAQELTKDIKASYKEELKKEIIEELKKDNTVLKGQKLRRILNNG